MANTAPGNSLGLVRRLSAGQEQPCTGDLRCDCLATRGSSVARKALESQKLLHMDECKDPGCADLAQLEELQRSLDQYTDYEHYERCCDGHHHHHNQQHQDECCDKGSAVCMTEDGSCDAEVCDECDDEHRDCFDEVDVCDFECEQCEEECEVLGHDLQDCPQDHPTTRDNCISAHHVPLPLLGPVEDMDWSGVLESTSVATPCTDDCYVPTPSLIPYVVPSRVAHQFDPALDHWQTFQQAHHCAPDPCLNELPPLDVPQHMSPDFGFTFGCDPQDPANRYPWQKDPSPCTAPSSKQLEIIDLPISAIKASRPVPKVSSPITEFQSNSSTSPPETASEPLARRCQWLMPCGSICGTTFATTASLKSHVKNSHTVKGVLSCRWACSNSSPSSSTSKPCTSSFASEAALTGHISKKHLSFPDESGPWKCTVPGCTKSFAYKQVRDDHVASHNGGNRMHCPICHQWLNCEGSNFRRHMAGHESKESHMRCKFGDLGCQRRFPRLDNLRRHEACCKFGKRARGVHHHHHTVHNHRHDATTTGSASVPGISA